MRIRIFYPTQKKEPRRTVLRPSAVINPNCCRCFFFVAKARAKNPDNLSFEKVRPDVHFVSQKEDVSGGKVSGNPDVDCNEYSVSSARRRGCQPSAATRHM